jgi:hypothetical protein
MKDAARGFAGGEVSDRVRPALNGARIQPELQSLAASFIDLQQARHEADYDIMRSFTRSEALDLVDQAEQSFDDWSVVKGTIQAETFLVSLLVLKALRT